VALIQPFYSLPSLDSTSVDFKEELILRRDTWLGRRVERELLPCYLFQGPGFRSLQRDARSWLLSSDYPKGRPGLLLGECQETEFHLVLACDKTKADIFLLGSGSQTLCLPVCHCLAPALQILPVVLPRLLG
jgi:hypothetical protein